MTDSTTTISFYSFKGGTGRSTSLANVAYSLAEEGYNVGCIDLDLAAPGLHMIFPNLMPAHQQNSQIHDHLRENNDKHIEDFIIDVGERIDRTVHSAPEGDLFLLSGAVKPPGKGNPRETMKRALSLKNDFIPHKELDYLLIDSRSGLSNHMIPIFDEADLFIAFHRWTHQHKLGTVRLGEWVDDKPVSRNMEFISVASNVPESTTSEDDIVEWVANNLYTNNTADFTDFHIINSSDILREGEQIVALDNPDVPVVSQFEGLAEKIIERDS